MKILSPQRFTKTTINRVILNNILIDYVYGHHEILIDFINRYSQYKNFYYSLSKLNNYQIVELFNKARRKCLLLFSIMLNFYCNAKCFQCCFKEQKNSKEIISSEMLLDLLYQSNQLGLETIYVAGQGEPFLDNKLYTIFDFARTYNKKVVVFTNGLIFENNPKLVSKLREYPVWIYYKLWSLNKDKNSNLLGLKEIKFNYINLEINNHTYNIPEGLNILLKELGPKRVGVETVILKENYKEIENCIIPLVEDLQIAFYLEKLIWKEYYSNFNIEFSESFNRYLVRKQCERLIYMINLQNDGFVTPCLNTHPNIDTDYKNIMKNTNLFDSRFSSESAAKARYSIDKCICSQ